MEIGTAVLLSSVLSGAGQFVATRAQAKAGQRTADIMAKQHKTNADLAKLQALQQENDRRKDFEMIEACKRSFRRTPRPFCCFVPCC